MIAESILARLAPPKPVESMLRKSETNFRSQTLDLSAEEFQDLDMLHMATWGEFIVTVRAKHQSPAGGSATFCFYRSISRKAAAV